MTITDRPQDTGWNQRYGDPHAEPGATGANHVVGLQLGHRSVRRFLPSDVSDEQLRTLVAAAQSAPTSSNLQPWSVVAVRDPERRRRLATLAARQEFVAQAPLLLVWVADLSRARRMAERHGRKLEAADYLETALIGFIDVALAAQNAVVAAESLGLGSCFVGAIRNNPEAVAAELGLPPHAMAAFGLAVGLPDPTEDAGVKPRLPQDAVLHHETYDAARADRHLDVYDERLADYNERHGLSGAWSDRVLTRLAGPESMAGRHRLREALEELGFPVR